MDALADKGLSLRSDLDGLDLTDYEVVNGLIDDMLSGEHFSDADRNLAKLRISNEADPLAFCIELSKLKQADFKLLHDHGMTSLQTLLDGLEVDQGFIAAMVLAIVGDAKKLFVQRYIMEKRLEQAVLPHRRPAPSSLDIGLRIDTGKGEAPNGPSSRPESQS